jgi:hypothetical protein
MDKEHGIYVVFSIVDVICSIVRLCEMGWYLYSNGASVI